MRSRETTKTRRTSPAELCCVWEEMTSRSRSKGGVSVGMLGKENRGGGIGNVYIQGGFYDRLNCLGWMFSLWDYF
jgi:hypothetical protein